MGNTPLILAALAKAAMPELDLVHTGELQNFDDEKSVVVTARDGVRYEVRMPRTQAALLHLGLEIRSLQALTEAARTRLPFGVARLVGEAKHIKGARVWLFELVQGAPANLHRANANGTLAENLGEALGGRRADQLGLEPAGEAGEIGLEEGHGGRAPIALDHVGRRTGREHRLGRRPDADLPVLRLQAWRAA